MLTFENLIYSFILTIMSDTGTGSDCIICVTNNGDIANVDKDLDLTDISVSSVGTVDLTDFDSLSESDNNNGDVDVHVDDNNPHTHHIVAPGFVDRPRRSDCTAGQMDGEAGWWTTSGNIGLPPLARVMGVGRQQHDNNHTFSNVL